VDVESGNNTLLINRILALRQESAELLGYNHHGDVSCASKMATFDEAVGATIVCDQEFALDDAIEFPAFAPLEALARLRPTACLSLAHCLLPVMPYIMMPRNTAGLMEQLKKHAYGFATAELIELQQFAENKQGARFRTGFYARGCYSVSRLCSA
jgi:hypothetical protein